METTLLQKLKKALADGDLDGDVRGDVLVEILNIITANSSYTIGLGFESKLDAAQRALELFLVGWKKIAKESDSIDSLNRRLKVLCINACQIERRRTIGIHDAPLGASFY